MSRKQRTLLIRTAVSAALLVAAYILRAYTSPDLPLTLLIFAVPYLCAGYDVLLTAARNILHGQLFDENFLMCIATVGAFCIGEYPEAVFVMVFYQAGELFQSIAVGKSRSSISALMELCPETATVIRNGERITVSPDEVEIGETVLVLPGERIPIDGIVLEGSSELNTAPLTGESLPRAVHPGDRVPSGCIDLTSPLTLQTETDHEGSTVSRILELVESAASSKAKSERFITRFARYYTPSVVIFAALLAIIPGIITSDLAEWLHRALIFLVISCPCALVISVPLSFFGGIGAASKRGILVKGSNYLEALAHVDTAVFDKTGTLTRGAFTVTDVVSLAPDADIRELFTVAASLEASSEHPIARSVVGAFTERYGEPPRASISELREISGRGLSAKCEGKPALIGNRRLMEENGIDAPSLELTASVLFVSLGGTLLGYLVISDTVKPTSSAAVRELKKLGVSRTVMLTGDRPEVAEPLARQLGLDEFHASLLPADKVSAVESLIQSSAKNKKVAFIGDGINDAPVLTRSDVGIAMGALGSDAAIEAADVVLMDDDPLKLAEAIRISRRTNGIVIQNIVFALTVKLVFLIMGAFGVAALWQAVFADVGVSVIAILNAMRTLSVGGSELSKKTS